MCIYFLLAGISSEVGDGEERRGDGHGRIAQFITDHGQTQIKSIFVSLVYFLLPEDKLSRNNFTGY